MSNSTAELLEKTAVPTTTSPSMLKGAETGTSLVPSFQSEADETPRRKVGRRKKASKKVATENAVRRKKASKKAGRKKAGRRKKASKKAGRKKAGRRGLTKKGEPRADRNEVARRAARLRRADESMKQAVLTKRKEVEALEHQLKMATKQLQQLEDML